jgi:hypothetical protein
VTGLLYVDAQAPDLAAREHLPRRPLADFGADDLRIGREDWARLMKTFV